MAKLVLDVNVDHSYKIALNTKTWKKQRWGLVYVNNRWYDPEHTHKSCMVMAPFHTVDYNVP